MYRGYKCHQCLRTRENRATDRLKSTIVKYVNLTQDYIYIEFDAWLFRESAWIIQNQFDRISLTLTWMILDLNQRVHTNPPKMVTIFVTCSKVCNNVRNNVCKKVCDNVCDNMFDMIGSNSWGNWTTVVSGMVSSGEYPPQTLSCDKKYKKWVLE